MPPLFEVCLVLILVVLLALCVAVAAMPRRARYAGGGRKRGNGGRKSDAGGRKSDAGGRGAALRCMTYVFPGGSSAPITALNLTSAGPKTIVTVYYPRGAITFTRKGSVPPWAQVVHTESPSHRANLHKVSDPYGWHTHIQAPSGKVSELVSKLLTNHGPPYPIRHCEQIARCWGRGGDPPPPKTLSDGSRVLFGCNTDTSGLDLLADLGLEQAVERGGEALAEALATAAYRIRPTSDVAIVAGLLKRVPRAALVAWSDNLGGFAHRVAKVGTAEALALLVATAAEADAARPSDDNTVAHLAAYRLATAKPAEKEAAQAVFDVVRGVGADFRVVNRYGESVDGLLTPHKKIPPGRYFVYVATDLSEELFRRQAAERGLAQLSTEQAQRAPAGSLCVALVRQRGVRLTLERKRLRAEVWGWLDVDVMTSKVRLHKLVAAWEPAVVPEVRIVKSGLAKAPAKPPGIWMWRPEGGWGGKGAGPVKTQADLAARWNLLDGRRAVLTQYIDDPLLVPYGGERYKFHLRILLIAKVDRAGLFSLALVAPGSIIRAKKPYVRDNYGDPDVHDTHLGEDPTLSLPYPEAYPGDVAVMQRKLAAMFTQVGKAAASQVKAYQYSKCGFHLLGADVMVDAAGRPWLIEINGGPGIKSLRLSRAADEEAAAAPRKLIYRAFWEWAIDPLLSGAVPKAPEGLTVLVGE